MAAVAPAADQTANLMQKLSIDSQPSSMELSEPAKKPSANQSIPVDSSDGLNGQFQPYERSLTPLLQDFMDPSVCYFSNGYPSTTYYYGGYDCPANDWDDYSRFINPDALEIPTGMYGDNASLMYHQGYGYGAYTPYHPAGSAVQSMAHDGQLYSPQHYQYPTPYFQPLNPSSGPYNPTTTSKVDVHVPAPADQTPVIPPDTNNSSSVPNGGSKGNGSSLKASVHKPPFIPNGSYVRGAVPGGIHPSGYQDSRIPFDTSMPPMPWFDASMYPEIHSRPISGVTGSVSNGGNVSRDQSFRPQPHFMNLQNARPMANVGPTPGYLNRVFSNKMFNHSASAFRPGYGFASNGYDSRGGIRGWAGSDYKYRPRLRSNGLFACGMEAADGLNELNRGPRAKNLKIQKTATIPSAPDAALPNGSVAKNEEEKVGSEVIPGMDQFNQADFSETYDEAKFFIIKSYSEDDVHKSIKYNMWASTPNGNKKLDAAYREAKEKPNGCPVFLFFSVNTSGQFLGMAEMVGPVDFQKNLEYWQQDKWNGCFSVKWHIVKDVPNSLLKHIILENNENKPVTNSRDTQEVKLEQGVQMVKIFKDHCSKTSILDDFSFYEDRQKAIQEKKARQQQLVKQVWEGKLMDDKSCETVKKEHKLLASAEVYTAKTAPISLPIPHIIPNGDIPNATASDDDSSS